MKDPGFLWLATHHAEYLDSESHPLNLPISGRLPKVSELMQKLDPVAFSRPKCVVLFEERLLSPLKIKVESRMGHREVGPYLRWKLKRYLDYPVEQAELRYLALGRSGDYLVQSIPRPWLHGFCAEFKKHHVQPGFMGPFSSLVMDMPSLAGHGFLALFHEAYLALVLDRRGNPMSYRCRRLPLDGRHQLDLTTLKATDIANVLRDLEEDQPLVFVDFSHQPERAKPLAELLRDSYPRVRIPKLSGSIIQRARALALEDKA